MNILVTGATGFIGKNLIKVLELNHRVHVLVRPATNMQFLNGYSFFVFEDNIDELSSYLIENKIDGIIHLASLYIAQHKNEQIKELVLSNIYLGTALLEASKQANIKWFLNTGTIWQNYISSSNEYCPVNLYAATKQSFIDIAKYYTETSDIRFCTLKLCDTYGQDDTRKKIVALFKQLAESGETLDMSPGEQKIDILHVDDVVKGFIQLAEMLQSDVKLEQEYALTSGKQHTLKELASLFEDITRKEISINWGGRSYREREVMIPCSSVKVLSGWKPMISIKEGIKIYVNG